MKESADFYYAHDLAGLPLLKADYKKQSFSRHVHEEYCIGVVDQGAQRFFRNGAHHIAPRHGIILVNPDQVHDGCSATESGWKYRAIYPKPELINDIQSELSSRNLGTALFTNPVVNDPQLAFKLRYFFDLLQYSDNRLQRESAFMSVISELLQKHAKQHFHPVPVSNHSPEVNKIREYIDCYYADNISTKQLSALVNLNPFYLTRLFQKHIGLPPHTYQIQKRLIQAKKLLLAGNSLLDTALSCGFSDQSHLNQHFKKWLGVTPGSFKKSIMADL